MHPSDEDLLGTALADEWVVVPVAPDSASVNAAEQAIAWGLPYRVIPTPNLAPGVVVACPWWLYDVQAYLLRAPRDRASNLPNTDPRWVLPAPHVLQLLGANPERLAALEAAWRLKGRPAVWKLLHHTLGETAKGTARLKRP
jgi:hypothetical protein